MKKIFAILAFAVMTLTVSAQGLKTFNGKLFSCQYPANFEAQEQWMDEAFNAKIEDSVEFLSVSVTDMDMTVQQLKDWADGMKMMTERSFGEPTGWKAGNVVVKGKQVTFRAEGEEEIDDEKVPAVKYVYCMVTPQKKCFTGELKFKKSDEAKYKPLVDKILASCKAK
jgi:hypothetical protein